MTQITEDELDEYVTKIVHRELHNQSFSEIWKSAVANIPTYIVSIIVVAGILRLINWLATL